MVTLTKLQFNNLLTKFCSC